MYKSLSLKESMDLPVAVRRSLGIGRFKAKVFRRPDGEVIAKATQDIGEVVIKLMHISMKDKVRSIELTNSELHKVLLMARDAKKMTGQPSEQECDEAWLEED
ncbi:hypothetical protein ACFLVX_04485 [Chloroflexota bacterium]